MVLWVLAGVLGKGGSSGAVQVVIVAVAVRRA
jgi:hypothetical protein